MRGVGWGSSTPLYHGGVVTVCPCEVNLCAKDVNDATDSIERCLKAKFIAFFIFIIYS